MVQPLRFCAFSAGGMNLIPGSGAKIPGSGQNKQTNKQKIDGSSSMRELNKTEMTDSSKTLGR